MMQHSHALYSFIYRHRRACLIGGAVLGGVIIAAVILYNILQNIGPAGTYPLNIAVVPGNATVHISAGPGKGNRLPSHGTAHLTPGEYTVQVERPGYSTYQQQVIIASSSPRTLYVGLAPQSPSARQEAQRNQRQYHQLERLSADAAKEFNAAYARQYPAAAKLPIKDPYYTIGYRYSASHGMVITIEGTSARYRAAAVQALYRAGINPSDYVVEFTNYTNPLAGEGGGHE